MMEAKVVYNHEDIQHIDVGDHSIEYSGRDTSGYCYKHQTFDCKLTPEEQEAVERV